MTPIFTPNLRLRIALLSLAGAAAASSAGCKATACKDGTKNCVELQSLVRYNGTPLDLDPVPWKSGDNVTISNDNGGVTVVADGTDSVTVHAAPFDSEGQGSSEEQLAKDTMTQHLHATAADSGGTITVSGKNDGHGSAGFDVTVHIPASFDGTLLVQPSNGSTTVKGGGSAKLVKVASGNGSIDASGLAGSISIHTENGDVTVQAAPTGADNVVSTGVGDIDLTLPTNGDLKVTAQTGLGNVNTPSPAPSGWTVSAADGGSSSASVQIGNGTGALQVSTSNGDITLKAQ
jgi:hypothetical protein